MYTALFNSFAYNCDYRGWIADSHSVSGECELLYNTVGGNFVCMVDNVTSSTKFKS